MNFHKKDKTKDSHHKRYYYYVYKFMKEKISNEKLKKFYKKEDKYDNGEW